MNKGAHLLAAQLHSRGDQAELARELGISQPSLSRWVNGERTPDIKHRAIMEDRYGIPWRSWDEPPAEGSDAA